MSLISANSFAECPPNFLASPRASNNHGRISRACIGNLSFENFRVIGNISGNNGGGFYLRRGAVVSLRNGTIAGNETYIRGGGIFAEDLYYGLTVGVQNVIIAENVAGSFGGGIEADESIIDSYAYNDVWNNSPDDYADEGWGMPDPTGTNGNVSVDPQFLDTTSDDPLDWDLHLSAGSPLIDAGDPSVSDPDGSVSDIGAYGGQVAADWDLDADNYSEWWQPGAYDGVTYPAEGWDCDDADDAVHADEGCDSCSDDDGDGICDSDDDCPADPYNDADDDGICGDVDVCPGFADWADLDVDGVPDGCDFCPSDPENDADADWICGDEDNCPDDANEDQEDLDEDDIGDVCDDDADGDDDPAETDCDDQDPTVYHGATEACDDGIDNDCNGMVDADDSTADCDADGVSNGADNCPIDANPGQVDTDADGDGDVCDGDDDGDGVLDDDDNCPLTVNPDQDDFDADGAGDECDEDSDGDTVPDDEDLCLDSSVFDVPTEGLGKNRWADIDGDGVFDTPGKNAAGREFYIEDTAGCTAAQIVDVCGYGAGHSKFGLSNGAMDAWTGLYGALGDPMYDCE